MKDTAETAPSEQSSQLPERTVLAFARELRRLAAQVERDLRRHEPVSALSALTAIRPVTGVLSDAAFAEATAAEEPPASLKQNTSSECNHIGYL